MLAYKKFTFPLNVYAHILCRDYGDFEYLHYGLFEQDDNQNIQRAQQRATDLLFSYLTPCPCRILEVGIGLGTTLAKLVKAGYDVIGITPDEHQINYAKNRYGENLPVVCLRLEDFTDEQKFDLIIFQESAQYIDTKVLFNKASSLLKNDGQIIIMDELSLRELSPSEPGLPWIDNYLSFGSTLGFELIEQIDLSNQALPTDIYILNAVVKYQNELVAELELDSNEIDGLILAAQEHLNKYHNGQYGYGFLQFKKKPIEQYSWITEWSRSNNEDELLDLFQETFGHKMPPELWRWKYQGLDTLGTLVRKNDHVIAFYGGMPRAIHLFGSPVTAIQISDVMVHPKSRGTLSRKGPFFQVATKFLERYVGEQQRYPIAFGFPSERAYRLSVHLGLYDKVGDLVQVSWPPLQARSSYKVRLRPLNHNKATTINHLWQKMAKALQQQIVGVRDWNYINHRYLLHPTLDYKLYQVSSRFTGLTLGIMVLRMQDDKIELVDVIAQPRHISTLVHCLRRLTWSLGKSQAYTWITQQNTYLFIANAGEISPTGITIPHNSWTPGLPASKLLDRWWLMAGDTDFH